MSDVKRVPRTYPEGVPSWVQLDVADTRAAADFYAGLFGWEPRDPTANYLFETLDDLDVAGIAPVDAGSAVWATYLACDDADSTAERVTQHGGRLLRKPEDAGPFGRWAVCADPDGTQFRLWQAGTCLGAQYVNGPGGWNFSVLLAPNPDASLAFYRRVFGWEVDPELGAGMIRSPGYGDHLAAGADPDIHERQSFAPPGFADVIAGAERHDGPPVWEVRFAVENRDETARRAVADGAVEFDRADGEWAKDARLRDPFGATFVVSQFDPQG